MRATHFRANFNSDVFEGDIADFDYGVLTKSIKLVAGGPPCQPFSLGGKAKGKNDSRDMFPEAIRTINELQPNAFIFENVKGLLRESFASYFEYIILRLTYPFLSIRENEDWVGAFITPREIEILRRETLWRISSSF